MIVQFSTNINGNQTYFREKIIKGIFPMLNDPENTDIIDLAPDFNKEIFLSCKPKIHTIRRNIERKYKKGVLLEMVFDKSMDKLIFKECQSIQRIFMTYFQGRFEVTLEDKYLYIPDIEEIATNDGFDSYEDFKKFFITQMDNEGCYSGYIIHWTNFEYNERN